VAPEEPPDGQPLQLWRLRYAAQTQP